MNGFIDTETEITLWRVSTSSTHPISKQITFRQFILVSSSLQH